MDDYELSRLTNEELRERLKLLEKERKIKLTPGRIRKILKKRALFGNEQE